MHLVSVKSAEWCRKRSADSSVMDMTLTSPVRFIHRFHYVDITPQVIAMGFPSSKGEGLYRNPMTEVQRFFNTRHKDHYEVINL